MSSSEDLKETVRQVEDLDRRIVAREADVRDLAGVQQVVDEGVREFGREYWADFLAHPPVAFIECVK